MKITSPFSFGGANMSVTFNNFDGRPIELKVAGDFWNRRADIVYNNIPVGRIQPQFMNAGQLLFDQQTYFLTAAPGGKSALTGHKALMIELILPSFSGCSHVGCNLRLPRPRRGQQAIIFRLLHLE